MTFRTFALRTTFVLVVGTILAGLWFYRSTFMLAFLASIIAVLISIPASYLQRLRVPRALAVAVAAMVIVLATSGIGFLLLPSIGNNLSDLAQRLPQLSDQLTRAYNTVAGRDDVLGRLLPPLTLELSRLSVPEQLEQVVRDTFSDGDYYTGLPVLVRSGNFVVTLLINLFLVVVLAIFFVAEPKAYVRASLYLVPEPRQPQLLALWSALYHTLRTWLATLLISITITVVLVLLILGPLGMPYLIEVAVFAGLATFIPTVGALLPVLLIVLVLLVADPARIPLMVAAYLGIQLLESNVLTPAVVRRQLSIPPAATLFTQLLAGLIFGVLGIVLAVPLLALAVVLVRELYSYGVLGLRGHTPSVDLPPSHARSSSWGVKPHQRRSEGKRQNNREQ